MVEIYKHILNMIAWQRSVNFSKVLDVHDRCNVSKPSKGTNDCDQDDDKTIAY